MWITQSEFSGCKDLFNRISVDPGVRARAVVADAGMLSAANLDAVGKARFGFIVGFRTFSGSAGTVSSEEPLHTLQTRARKPSGLS